MTSPHWVSIGMFSSRVEAEVVKGMLEDAGLAVRMKTDDMGGLQPAMALTSGVELLVASDDETDALRLLKAVQAPTDDF